MMQRPPGCLPMTLNIPMWQRWVGFFLADLGNWIAGFEWSADQYMRGVRDVLDMQRHDAEDQLEGETQ